MTLPAGSMTELLENVVKVAQRAGQLILEVYSTEFAVRGKADDSPVTEADARAEELIVAALRELTPSISIVAEEAVADGRVPVVGDCFWLVDPLDGTKEFVNRNGEFTVNIALVRDGQPVLGVVYAPALGRLFAGLKDHGAFVSDTHGRRHIRCRAVPADGLAVVASRSHADRASLDRYLAGRKVASLVNAGSSLKICMIAEGAADLYPRLGRTMEWDIAAGHAVLNAAGGVIRSTSGEELRYAKPGFANPDFVAQAR